MNSARTQRVAFGCIWAAALFTLGVLALVVGLIMVRRIWEEAHEDLEPVSQHKLLSEFERAYYAGEMDEAELRKVREVLHGPERAEASAGEARTGQAPEPRTETGPLPDDDSEENLPASS